MPATPFHFGPGLLIKAIAPRQFSVAAYSVAQVVIDIESGYHLLHHDYPVHRQAHTFFLGGLIGLTCGLVVSRVGRRLARPRDLVPEALAAEYRMPMAAWSGAFGGMLHALLDGIMHADARPLRPFSDANPFYGFTGVSVLYLLCIITGLVGAAVLLAWERRARRL